MKPNRSEMQAATIDWMSQTINQCTYAVTLTLKPYTTDDGKFREQLDEGKAKVNFDQFLKRLNYAIFGNAARRSNKKSITVIPVLEGRASGKLLHYHCAIGGIPDYASESHLRKLIAEAWHGTRFGNQQIDVKKITDAIGWLSYITKEMRRNTDAFDVENIRISSTVRC